MEIELIDAIRALDETSTKLIKKINLLTGVILGLTFVGIIIAAIQVFVAVTIREGNHVVLRILGQNDEVLEASEAVHPSELEAQMAGYRRVKERPDYLIGEIPRTGGKLEGELRSVAVIGPTITAKQKEQ